MCQIMNKLYRINVHDNENTQKIVAPLWTQKKRSCRLISTGSFFYSLITIANDYSSQQSSSSEHLSFEQSSSADSYSNKSGKNISSSLAADTESSEP